VRKRHYVLRGDDAFYFPRREPKGITFPSLGPQDPYERLFRDEVVSIIERLVLPRYGCSNTCCRTQSRRLTLTHASSPPQLD